MCNQNLTILTTASNHACMHMHVYMHMHIHTMHCICTFYNKWNKMAPHQAMNAALAATVQLDHSTELHYLSCCTAVCGTSQV